MNLRQQNGLHCARRWWPVVVVVVWTAGSLAADGTVEVSFVDVETGMAAGVVRARFPFESAVTFGDVAGGVADGRAVRPGSLVAVLRPPIPKEHVASHFWIELPLILRVRVPVTNRMMSVRRPIVRMEWISPQGRVGEGVRMPDGKIITGLRVHAPQLQYVGRREGADVWESKVVVIAPTTAQDRAGELEGNIRVYVDRQVVADYSPN